MLRRRKQPWGMLSRKKTHREPSSGMIAGDGSEYAVSDASLAGFILVRIHLSVSYFPFEANSILKMASVSFIIQSNFRATFSLWPVLIVCFSI